MATYDIFISYSRKDHQKVKQIATILQDRGYSVWIDIDGVESGEAFRGVIVNAIENSQIVLFFSSASSNSSSWTTKEISLAVDEKKYIIPIKLDTTKYNNSIRFDLIDLDYIDLTDNASYDISLSRLLKSIKNKIGERQSPKIHSSENPNSDKSSDIVALPQKRISLTGLKNNIISCWSGRNMIINVILCVYIFIAIYGCIFPAPGIIFAPAAIFGIIGIFLLLTNRKNGFAFLIAGCFLWLLGNAYGTAPDAAEFRFFKNAGFMSIWPPFIIASGSVGLLFIKKNGKSWGSNCNRMDVIGIVSLTIAIIFWLWTIYFDIVTKYGLPPNFRHYINRITG